MDIHHDGVVLRNSAGMWREDVEVQAVLVHISYAFGGARVSDRLGASRTEIGGLQQLEAFVPPRRLEPPFVHRRHRVWYPQEDRGGAQFLFKEFGSGSVRGGGVRVVVEVHLESLNLSLFRLDEDVSLFDQAVWPLFALEVFSPTS